MLFKAQLRDPLSRRGRPAAVPIGEELLLERLVLEYVKINDPPEATRNPETELAPTSPAAFGRSLLFFPLFGHGSDCVFRG